MVRKGLTATGPVHPGLRLRPSVDRRRQGSGTLLHRLCMPNIPPKLLDPPPRADEVAAVHAPSDHKDSSLFTPDSRLAWVRLALALALGSVGGGGMWSVVGVMPGVTAGFGASRRAVSLAFTLTMLGFGLGGVATGK